MSSRLISSIALVVVALAANGAGAQGLEWTTDLAGAQRTAAQTNRLVLVHFGGTWCKPCRDMEEQVFAKAGLNYAVMPNFVPVKIDVQYGEQNELARQLGVNGFPSDIIMTPQGTVVERSTGFKAAPEYLSMLNQAAQKARAAQPAAPGANVANVAPPMPAQAVLPPQAGSPIPPPVQPALAPGANAMGLPPLPAGAASPLTAMRNMPAPPPPVALPAVGPAAAPVGIAPPLPAPGPVAPRTVLPPPPTTAPAIVPSTPPLGVPQTAPAGVSHAPAAGPAGIDTASAPRTTGPSTLPPGSPPLALDGYCPVTVTEKMTWNRGDVRFGAIHRGRTYLFASATEQAKFLSRPDRYSPIMSGNDPVAWLEQGKPVPGKREHGIMLEGVDRSDDRMILFASEASKDKFRSDQKRYEFEIKQAMQAGGGQTMRR
jgi:thiol-disulfide isomerase/thioredoxin/YHS domain-containing protein